MKPIPPAALGAVVAAVVLAAVTTVLVNGRGPADLPAGSPEAAVQAYLEALRAHDDEAVLEALSPDSGCTTEDIEMAWFDDDMHVTLHHTRVSPTRARVDVKVTSDAGGIVPGGWAEDQTFRLARAGADAPWLIDTPAWPLYDCAEDFR